MSSKKTFLQTAQNEQYRQIMVKNSRLRKSAIWNVWSEKWI